LLDGVHLCQSYLQRANGKASALSPLAYCVFAESSLAHAEVSDIVARCESNGVQCISLPDALYQALSQVEHGVGILFVVETPVVELPAALNRSAVVLDHLQDPGNLGSILRSAAAAGITHVYCSEGTVAAWSPKVLRAGMGAHFMLEIVENVDLTSALSTATIPILATSSHTTQTIYQADLNQEIIWLFGHEGQGVDAALMALASATVTIPQRPEIESLNVAASAAICFFEQVRQQLKA
jgi:RNA methyltransferase, TrmH family